jgi:hypothetical protein
MTPFVPVNMITYIAAMITTSDEVGITASKTVTKTMEMFFQRRPNVTAK